MIRVPAGRRIVLASGSPRRADLLASVSLPFDVAPADIDEAIADGETPPAYVLRLSAEKARTAARPDRIVIAADTTVEIDGRVLGKPHDAADASRMLRSLAARTHHVHTGVTVIGSHQVLQSLVTTAVEFVALDDGAIDWYVATGEPFDKAGAYAIQGAAGAFVSRVDGSVSNVIGLPLAETLALVRAVLDPPTR